MQNNRKNAPIVFLLALCTLLSQHARADIITGMDAPDSLVKVLEKVNDALLKKVAELNQSNKDLEYFYDPTTTLYGFHLSLSSISQFREPLDRFFQRTKCVNIDPEKYPNIPADPHDFSVEKMIMNALTNIANNTPAIDISANVQQTTFDFWKGAEGKIARKKGNNGKDIKNFYFIVVRLKPSPALQKLADDMKFALGTTPLRPFSAHFTVGQIFEKNDSPAIHDLIASLQKELASVSTIFPEITQEQVVLDYFELKGDQETYKRFDLKKAPEKKWEVKAPVKPYRTL